MNSIIRKIFLSIVLISGMLSLQSCNYNSLVEKQQSVDQNWRWRTSISAVLTLSPTLSIQ